MSPVRRRVEALLPQVSSESGKDAPIETQVGQASQKVTRLQKEFSQAVDARQNAERLHCDTKEKAIRIAEELEQAEEELRNVCTKRAAAEDCKDRSPRTDLAQLLEPDAASRIILDDIGVIGDESELDLTDEERAAYQAHKKKFAEDLAAAVQSSWGTLRQLLQAKRAEALEAQKQWIKKRKVEVVEIGSRIGDAPDVSDLGDVADMAPVTEQQAIQKKELLAASIKDEARRRRSAKNHP